MLRLKDYGNGNYLTVASLEQESTYKAAVASGKGFIVVDLHGYPHKCIVERDDVKKPVTSAGQKK